MKLEWSSCIKPLLAAAYGNQDGISKLIHLIPLCEEELLNHAEEHEAFYSSFTALCVHFISNYAPSVGRNKSGSLTDTFELLCTYVVKKMGADPHNSTLAPTQYSLVVKSLCTVSGFLNRSDVITLAAQMKSSLLPDHVRGTMGAEKVGNAEKAMVKGSSVSRELDPLGSVLTFVSGTLSDLPPAQPLKGKESKSSGLRAYQEQLANDNTHRLVRLGIASHLADLCTNMKSLTAVTKQGLNNLKSGKALGLPQLEDAAQWKLIDDHLGALLSEIEVIGWLTDLRVWENMDGSTLEKLSDLGGMLALAAGLGLAARHSACSEASGSRDKDWNAYLVARTVATKVSGNIRNILKHSSVSNQSAQNAATLESSAICAALSILIKDCDLDVSLAEFSEHFLNTVTPILKETKKSFAAKKDKIVEFSVNQPLSSWQRLDFIGCNTSLIHVFLSITKKALEIGFSASKSEKKEEPKDLIDNLIEMEEKRLSSDFPPLSPGQLSRAESGASGEGSSILGGWLEELLWSVPQLSEGGGQGPGSIQSSIRRTSAAADAAIAAGSLKTTFPDTARALNVAAEFLRSINTSFMVGNGMTKDLLKDFVRHSLTPEATTLLAEIIKLADRNHSKLSSGLIGSLAKLCHNMFASSATSTEIEDNLLDKMLEFDLKGSGTWPFNLQSLRLAVLGQVLLIRQQREAEELGRGKTESVVVTILERFIHSLLDASLQGMDRFEPKTNAELYWEWDVSAEHTQLMLLIFQSLQRSSKFRVFASLRKAIVSLSAGVDNGSKGVCPHGARLLLLFEYICRHFYEPAPLLPEQVQQNIFSLSRGEDERPTETALYACPEVEEPFRIRLGFNASNSGNAIFYHICSSPNEWLESEKSPRLDNMAINAVIEDPESTNFYKALIKLQCVGPRIKTRLQSIFLEALELGSVQYLQSVLSRVLSFLPIPFSYLLEATKQKDPSLHALHHTLRLAPRFHSILYVSWLKEYLSKEKSGDYSEAALTEMTATLTSSIFNVRICSLFFQKIDHITVITFIAVAMKFYFDEVQKELHRDSDDV